MYIVDKETQLMNFLLEKTNKKRNDIKNLLKYENIYVDGHIQTHYAYQLVPGQKVEISKQPKNKLEIDIIYEDDEVIVVNKPCGLLTEQTQSEKEKTAYVEISKYVKQKDKRKGRQYQHPQSFTRDPDGCFTFGSHKK